jgi:hypothetical protein
MGPIPIPSGAFGAVRMSAVDSSKPGGDWTMAPFDIHNVGNGVSQNHIDMFVLKDGDTYHGFQKNDDEDHIEHLEAAKLEGPWEYKQTNDFAHWGRQEGPSVTRNKDNNGWIIYMDNFHGQYYYTTGSDLSNWDPLQKPPRFGDVFRHGTVFKNS